MPARLPWIAAALVALAACDAADTRPARANRYDPAFDGARILTMPTGFAATALGPSSVTLTWTDQSSFEAGFVIEEERPDGSFRTVARLPPDTERYVWDDLSELLPRVVRVQAIGGGGDRSSQPTPSVSLYPPVSTRTVTDGRGQVAIYTFDPQARWFYTIGWGDPQATVLPYAQSPQALTGTPLGAIRDFTVEGQAVLFSDLSNSVFQPEPTNRPIPFWIYEGPRQVRAQTWTLPADLCTMYSPVAVRLSGDAQRLAIRCRSFQFGTETLYVAPLDDSGATPVRHPLPFQVWENQEFLSRDGRAWFVHTTELSQLVAYDVATLTPRWTYSIPRYSSSRILPTPDRSRIVVSYLNHVEVLDAATGQVMASRELGGTFNLQNVSTHGVTLVGQQAPTSPSGLLVLRLPDLAPVVSIPGTYDTSVASATGAYGLRRIYSGYVLTSREAGTTWRLTPLS